MSKNLSNEQVDEFAKAIEGTLNSFDSVCNELFGINSSELDMDTLERFDDLVFECVICGWWYDTGEIDEIDGENACHSCAEEHDEE